MYYIMGNDRRYYAGRCCSDKITLVWKDHYSRALSFDTMLEAINYAKHEGIFFLGIEYKVGG